MLLIIIIAFISVFISYYTIEKTRLRRMARREQLKELRESLPDQMKK